MKNPTYKTGIYFLLNKGVVVYVGQTTRYPRRLYYHYNQALPHDCVRFIQCDSEKLNEYEKRWIKRFKPEYNTVHNVPAPKKVKAFKNKRIQRRMTFRVLTKKSYVGFGFNKDRTIENLLTHGRIIEVLSMYYNLSHISFREDVLDELKISSQWRIVKPGTDKQKFFEFCQAFYPDEYNRCRETYIKKIRVHQRIDLKRNMAGAYNKEYNRYANQKL